VTYDPTPPPSMAPHYSPDGQWWWTGTQWIPATNWGQATSAAPPDPGTNGSSIASLILGILWLGGFGSLAAVICGHIAHGQIKRSGQRGRGLATAGLILGYLGLAVTAALVVLLIVVGVGAAKSVHRDAQVRSDLQKAANAEEAYNTVHQQYTDKLSDLATSGLTALPGSVTLVVGVNGQAGYCIVGSDTDASFPRVWSLYDSENGGLQGIYVTEAQAEDDCSDPLITQFGSLTGAGT
jgi:Domain of unknown function (DUF4190)